MTGLPLSSESVTRGISFKIIIRRCHYDLRKYSFCNQITNLWNSLPDTIVTAPSLNIFKNRLDKYWINQDVLYVWHAEISGSGSRSNICQSSFHDIASIQVLHLRCEHRSLWLEPITSAILKDDRTEDGSIISHKLTGAFCIVQ